MSRTRPTALLLALAALACGGTSSTIDPDDNSTSTTNPPTFELIGEWDDNYGTHITITQQKWGNETLVGFDNATNVAFVQMAADDKYNPSKFAKHVWTEPVNGVFYDCWVDYGKATLDEVKASTATADASKPEEGGCAGFAWTKLTKAQ